MHELSIAMSILDIASEESRRHGGARVQAIHVKLGPLSGVVARALVSAYELTREFTTFGDSRLVIEESPIVAFCPACESQRIVDSIQRMCCSHCGQPVTEIVSGREMEITAMEIDDSSRGQQPAVPESEASRETTNATS